MPNNNPQGHNQYTKRADATGAQDRREARGSLPRARPQQSAGVGEQEKIRDSDEDGESRDSGR